MRPIIPHYSDVGSYSCLGPGSVQCEYSNKSQLLAFGDTIDIFYVVIFFVDSVQFGLKVFWLVCGLRNGLTVIARWSFRVNLS